MNINNITRTIYINKGPKTHMKINNLAAALGVAALALVALVPAQAQSIEQFASVTGGNGTFTYTGGAGGGLAMAPTGFYASLDVPSAGTLINNPATVLFTGLSNVGTTAESTANGVTTFDQRLTGGNFTLTDGKSGTVLLTGAFQGADLTGVPGTSQAGVSTNFFGVSYSGGLYASSSGILLGPQTEDSFNFSLIGAKPNLNVSGNTLQSFTSAGNGQFTGITPSVTTVPEPASVIPFAIGGLALLGLIARKTRRVSGTAA